MAEPPPQGYDGLAHRLASLRVDAGEPSYSRIAQRIGQLRASAGRGGGTPGRVTVHDAFRMGRRRIDSQLVLDLAVALGGPGVRDEWRTLVQEAIRFESARAVRARPHASDVVAPSGLVGREIDSDRLHSAIDRELVEDRRPVVVITGMPGVGKTALARSVAAKVALRREVPAIEVALRAASGTTGGRDAGPLVVARSVKDFVQSRPSTPIILVVDDVATEDELAKIVDGLPETTAVIATSRRALDVEESALTLRLDPLTSEASQELLARAAEGLESDRRWIERLSDLSGGLPLSLDLIAARFRSHPDWTLEDHAHALQHAADTIAPTVAEALGSLSPPARRALHLAAVHPGRLTEDELIAFGGDTDVDVDALVRAHLLTRGEDSRHDMHDVVRELGRAQAFADVAMSRLRSGAHRLVAALVRAGEDLPLDAEYVITTAQLAAELDLRSAVSELDDAYSERLQTAQLLTDAYLLLDIARHHGRDDAQDDAERRWMLLAAGVFRREDEVVPVARRRAADPSDPHHARALIDLGQVMLMIFAPTAEIAAILAEGYDLAVACGDHESTARGGVLLARCDVIDEDFDAALSRIPTVVAAAREADEHGMLVRALMVAAESRFHLDDLDGAAATAREIIALAADDPDPFDRQLARALLGETLVLTGRAGEARRIADDLLSELEGSTDWTAMAWAHALAFRAHAALEDYDAARRQVALIRAVPGEGEISMCCELASIDLIQGDLDAAEAGYRLALSVPIFAGMWHARAEMGLGDVARARGDEGSAREHWLRARDMDPPVRDRRAIEERLAGLLP